MAEKTGRRSVGWIIGFPFAVVAVWLGWNVLDAGQSMGLGEPGFWGLVLLTLALYLTNPGRLVLLAVLMIVEPGWWADTATARFPEPGLWHFVGFALLALVIGMSNARWADRRDRRPSAKGRPLPMS